MGTLVLYPFLQMTPALSQFIFKDVKSVDQTSTTRLTDIVFLYTYIIVLISVRMP